MTLNNISLIDNLNTFTNISPDVRVQFSISKGDKNYNLGRANKSYTCKEKPYCLSTFNLTYTGLKRGEADELRTLINTVKHQVKFFPFNDFSDNYVFNWERSGVRQNGILVEIGGAYNQFSNLTSYKLCKRYSVGQSYTLKPIHFFPPEAEIIVDDDPRILVDRETGTIDFLPPGLTGRPFEADLYYTLVRISSDVTIKHYYEEGLDSDADYSQVESQQQRYSVNFSLKEVRINQVLNYTNMLPDPQLPVIEKIDLDGLVSNSTITEKTLFNKYQHNNFWAAENPANSKPVQYLSIPSRTTKHKELIYLISLFRGSAGSSFNLSEPTII